MWIGNIQLVLRAVGKGTGVMYVTTFLGLYAVYLKSLVLKSL